jgi:hypothetical protein
MNSSDPGAELRRAIAWGAAGSSGPSHLFLSRAHAVPGTCSSRTAASSRCTATLQVGTGGRLRSSARTGPASRCPGRLRQCARDGASRSKAPTSLEPRRTASLRWASRSAPVVASSTLSVREPRSRRHQRPAAQVDRSRTGRPLPIRRTAGMTAGTLSGGEQQMLAPGAHGEARLLILDEPRWAGAALVKHLTSSIGSSSEA